MPLKPVDFEELLSPNRAINSRISQALENCGKNCIFLFIVDLRNYSSTVVELLRVLQERDAKGVYLTINKPANDLINGLKSQKIETSNVFFIDAVSSLSEREISNSDNILALDSPTDLIEMSNVVSKRVSASPKPDFVVFDSLSTLLLYNKPMAVEKFVHVLVGKVRGSDALGFLIAIKSSEHAGLIETISQFVDKIVEI